MAQEASFEVIVTKEQVILYVLLGLMFIIAIIGVKYLYNRSRSRSQIKKTRKNQIVTRSISL